MWSTHCAVFSIRNITGTVTQYYRVLWFSQGIWKYTKFGYERAQLNFDPNSLNVTLQNKVAIVTGSSSGLGYESAYQLALRGATVHIICRNKERGEDALVSLRKKSNNEKIFLHLVDLSNLKAINLFCLHFKSNNDRIDILLLKVIVIQEGLLNHYRLLELFYSDKKINNAGAMIHSYQLTEEGIESNFAINTLGTYYLTELLLPLLQRSDDARVFVNKIIQSFDVKIRFQLPASFVIPDLPITVTSGGMLTQSLEDLKLPAPVARTSTHSTTATSPPMATCPNKGNSNDTDNSATATTTTTLPETYITTTCSNSTTGNNHPRQLNKDAEEGNREVERRSEIPTVFDGTAIYAQNKRQQVELTDYWAERYRNISTLQFYSMHPGWTDTPGLATSLPAFRNSMRQWLRTPEQGADTIVWAAAVVVAARPPSGSFLEDRKSVPKHLPFTNTVVTTSQRMQFIESLNTLIYQIVGAS